MPTIGSTFVYEIKDYQIYAGQQVLNIYNYYQVETVTPASASAVATVFDQDILSEVVKIQNTAVAHTLIEVTQLGSLSNFGTRTPTNDQGTLPGGTENVAPFIAARLDLLRTTKETRRGYKRIVGQKEENMVGAYWSSAYIALLETLANVLSLQLPVTAESVVLEPCIVGIRKDVNGNQLPVAQWVYNQVADVQAQPVITTQNSRKLGRGA